MTDHTRPQGFDDTNFLGERIGSKLEIHIRPLENDSLRLVEHNGFDSNIRGNNKPERC